MSRPGGNLPSVPVLSEVLTALDALWPPSGPKGGTP